MDLFEPDAYEQIHKDDPRSSWRGFLQNGKMHWLSSLQHLDMKAREYEAMFLLDNASAVADFDGTAAVVDQILARSGATIAVGLAAGLTRPAAARFSFLLSTPIIFGAIAKDRSGIVRAGDRAPHAPDGPPGSGPIVTFSRSDLAVPWDDRYPSLLDLAETCDIPVGFGCRNGTCHNCESGLLAGEVTYHTEPLEPPPDGRVLVCSSRPSSELTLDL